MNRSRFSDGRNLGAGLPPSELWGVSQRNRGEPHHKPGEGARKRRWQRRQAKALGIAFKSWLRRERKAGRL